jgi:adenylate kinase
MITDRAIRAIVLEVAEPELERRLTARRICSKCKSLFTSASVYGSEEELCSKCGSMLITRDDDNIDVIRNRLRTYRETAEPLIAYYRRRGVLTSFDGALPPDEVTEAILRHIDGPARKRRRESKAVARP